MYTPIYSIKLETNASIFTRRPVIYDGRVRSLYPLLDTYFRTLDREHFIVILLDARLNVIGLNTVGIGTLNMVNAPFREIFKPVVLGNAYGIIVAHNHPSGNCNPSDEDNKLHSHLKSLCDVMGLYYADNIIVGSHGAYFSYTEKRTRESYLEVKKVREKAARKARLRMDRGEVRHRDKVLLAADRLSEVPGMIKTEAATATQEVIELLRPIVETSARIHKATRSRAGKLLEYAEACLASGHFTSPLVCWDSLIEEAVPSKPRIPVVDFVCLPEAKSQ